MSEETGKNEIIFGFQDVIPRITDYFFRKGTKIEDKEILVVNGQWDDFVPTDERQRFKHFDSMACVSFSALNIIETLLKKLSFLYDDFLGDNYDPDHINFSDRFTAKMSGTTAKGNWAYKVADSIRKDGLVRETVWPAHDSFSRDIYYSEIPDSIKDLGKVFLKAYDVKYEWVTWKPDNFLEALQYAPLQVSIRAWYKKGLNGYYTRVEGTRNHMISIFGYVVGKYWDILDHYPPYRKKLAWDFNFGNALKYHVSQKQSLMSNLLQKLNIFKNSYDLKLIRNSKTSEWGWYYNNALRIPKSTARKTELLAHYLLRTQNNPSAVVSPEVWAKLPKLVF